MVTCEVGGGVLSAQQERCQLSPSGASTLSVVTAASLLFSGPQKGIYLELGQRPVSCLVEAAAEPWVI